MSFNPNDVAERYCGFCHEYHNERKEKKNAELDRNAMAG